MARTNTTLSAACGANDVTISVTSATGFADRQLITVDNEVMVQVGAAVGTTIPVRRGGQQGTTQVAHVILAPVSTMLPGDMSLPRPAQAQNIQPAGPVQMAISVDGTLTLPAYDSFTQITKAGVCAITLATAPTGVPDGIEHTIHSTTANAHTITYAAGFNGDTTSSDVATFNARIGNSITLVTSRGLYGVKALAGVTIA